MSAVVLQVGQCGNQLGLDWWKLINKKSNHHKKRCPFSSRNGELAAVCVDTEPKVLRKAYEFVKNRKIRPSNIIEGKGGRGGNWAYGYHGARFEGDNGLLKQTMEALRQEAERQDYYGGTVLLHSLTGGTGSGLGSRLCEEIREEFPVRHILTVSVVPHHSGESPLQHYNTLLSLAALHSGQSLGMEPWELVRSVCPIPTAKLLYTTQASASEMSQWDTLASETVQNLPQLSPDGKPYSSRAVLAVARGNHDNSFIVSKALQKLRQAHRCVPWNPFPVDHWTDPRNEANVCLSARMLTVCSNHSSVTRLLGHVAQRATQMLKARAYLHWYERYGIETEEFQRALNTLSDLTENYETQ
ncbi:tubulin beta-8 chain-like isoform X3 [Tachysurus fulvidraco]|uniref:tubulin beta-8 chain-like isoform X3 n=1 Tax=Tachysurus fulvidraco TaxID=1234273 RepID=UPI001FEF8B0A|nr:tubulin beta-8 chain-like isoform X3 [Tachysurus fulvidraco]